MSSHPPLFILTGASGVGKTSIAQRLLQRNNLRLVKLVTCTTRPKRPAEKHGRDYRFYRKDDFKNKIAHGQFFEWAQVYGQYYGSLKTDMARTLKSEKPILIVVNVQGAKTIKKFYPRAVVIFIDAPLVELKRRLIKRGMTSADLKTRLSQIVKEQKFKKQSNGVILNQPGKLTRAVQDIARLIKNKLHDGLTLTAA